MERRCCHAPAEVLPRSAPTDRPRSRSRLSAPGSGSGRPRRFIEPDRNGSRSISTSSVAGRHDGAFDRWADLGRAGQGLPRRAPREPAAPKWRTRSSRNPSALRARSARSTCARTWAVTSVPYGRRDARHGDAGLSALGIPRSRASARTSALPNPVSTSGWRTACSAAARRPGRQSPTSSALAPENNVAKPRSVANADRDVVQLGLAVVAAVAVVAPVAIRSRARRCGSSRARCRSHGPRSLAPSSSPLAERSATPPSQRGPVLPASDACTAATSEESTPPENATIAPGVVATAASSSASVVHARLLPRRGALAVPRRAPPPRSASRAGPSGRRPRHNRRVREPRSPHGHASSPIFTRTA